VELKGLGFRHGSSAVTVDVDGLGGCKRSAAQGSSRFDVVV